MAKIERSNPGPPNRRCSFNTETGYLVITIEDPVAEEEVIAACAITLSPDEARGLAKSLEAFCDGQRSAVPYKLVRAAPDPFERSCTFDAPSGELTVKLAYDGVPALAASATITLRSDGGDDDEATVLLDALRLHTNT